MDGGVTNNWQNENGFEFAFYPAKTGKAESLILILHGYGGNAKGWQQSAAQLQEKIPGADVIALQGPIKVIHPDLPPGKEGFMWFQYNGGPFLKQAKLWLTHIFNHLPVIDNINAFADAQLAKRGLKPENLGLIGQSMGAIAAVQTGLYRKQQIAGIVSHSGVVLPLTKVRSRPEVLLVMGENDPIFNRPPAPPQRGLKRIFAAAAKLISFSHRDSARRLDNRQVPHTDKIIPGMAHEVTRESWEAGNNFLARLLQKNPQP